MQDAGCKLAVGEWERRRLIFIGHLSIESRFLT
jgi:hypothetical protein